MDNPIIPLVVALVVGFIAGGYAMYLVKNIKLPADMDAVISAAVSAITQVQTIYGDNSYTNEQKATESLNIALRALKDAGITVNAATLALIIRTVYHALKPQVKALPKSDGTIYSGVDPKQP